MDVILPVEEVLCGALGRLLQQHNYGKKLNGSSQSKGKFKLLNGCVSNGKGCLNDWFDYYCLCSWICL